MQAKNSTHNVIELSDALETVTSRLEEVGVSTQRFVEIQDQKASYDHTKYRSQHISSEKYGVIADGDLVILDVDDWEQTSESVRQLVSETPTFTVESPHAEGSEGHYYFKCVGDVPNKRPAWGEIRSDGWFVVGPGSILEACNKSYHDCSLPGRGVYTIRQNQRIATIPREALPIEASSEATDESSSSKQRPVPHVDLPAYEEELADVGRAILRDLEDKNRTAYRVLQTLLEGGVSRYSDTICLTDEQGEYIDRDQQENLALLFLYGTIQRIGKVEDEDRAKRVLFSTFHAYMREYPRTNRRGRKRKWIERGGDYRANRLGTVLEDFDEGQFIRFLNLNNTPTLNRFEDQGCSEVNFNYGQFAVDLLSGLWDIQDVDELIDHARSFYDLDIEREACDLILSSIDRESGHTKANSVESIEPMQNHEGLPTYPTNEKLFNAVNELGSSIS